MINIYLGRETNSIEDWLTIAVSCKHVQCRVIMNYFDYEAAPLS